MTDSSSLTDTTGRRDSGDPRTIVAVAWPTGRPIYAYTAEELAEGVDVYTKAMKAGTAKNGGRGDA